MIIVNVDLGDCVYLIYIGVGLIGCIELFVYYIKGLFVMIVMNMMVDLFYGDVLCVVFVLFGKCVLMVVLLDGEVYKNWEMLNLIFDGLLMDYVDCKMMFVVFGGGVVGDMIGFVVVCYMCGVLFI